jgi:hypothetical protein
MTPDKQSPPLNTEGSEGRHQTTSDSITRRKEASWPIRSLVARPRSAQLRHRSEPLVTSQEERTALNLADWCPRGGLHGPCYLGRCARCDRPLFHQNEVVD